MDRRLPEIDALRGLAACGVAFFFHFVHLTGVRTGPLYEVPGVWWLYEGGWVLVDLFFVLSGFIFSHVYLRDDQPIVARSFFVNRIARLYPLHLTTLLACAGLQLLAAALIGKHLVIDNNDGFHFALNLLFLEGSGLEQGFSFNSPSWSLTAEMACYLLFFLAAAYVRRFFIPACIGLVAIGLIGGSSEGAVPLLNSYISRGLVGFFIGCLLYRALPTLERLPLPIVLAASGVAVAVMFKGSPISKHVGVAAESSLLVWPPLIVLALRSPFSRLLRTRPLRYLGDLSFSIYLWHVPVQLLLLLANGGRYFAQADWPWVFPLTIAAVIAVSHLSFVYLEDPARRWLRRYAESQRPALVPAE